MPVLGPGLADPGLAPSPTLPNSKRMRSSFAEITLNLKIVGRYIRGHV
jgi:hypothetical protein